eukprot:14375647-Ditylum_brightwellii.AAC.1
MRGDHGRPPAKPPWITTSNSPTAMPHNYQQYLSKSKYHQAVNTSKPNNDSLDQKQQQTYLPGKPTLVYICEPTNSSKDNDTVAHSVCSLWRLFLLVLFLPHLFQQVYNTLRYAKHIRAFAIVFTTTVTTTKVELRPTEPPQTAPPPWTDPKHCTKTQHTAATCHHLNALQRRLRWQ